MDAHEPTLEELQQIGAGMAKLVGEQQQRVTAKLDKIAEGAPNPLIDRLREMHTEMVTFHQAMALRLQEATNNGYFDDPVKLASLSSSERKFFENQVDLVVTLVNELSKLDDETRISANSLKQEVMNISTVELEEKVVAAMAILDDLESLESNHRSRAMVLLDQIEVHDRVIRTFLEERHAVAARANKKSRAKGRKRWFV